MLAFQTPYLSVTPITEGSSHQSPSFGIILDLGPYEGRNTYIIGRDTSLMKTSILRRGKCVCWAVYGAKYKGKAGTVIEGRLTPELPKETPPFSSKVEVPRRQTRAQERRAAKSEKVD
ncbi:hypothetical protein Dda_8713 [Drechslerella dactyloides]|uniref:Uncharacterized protein n=1 Tax=Drechslerella dactyloides TaxID=74499 RepID=A0AAD6IQW3_DREDA|nr:hypothetical protein Dda_8713 [Drechslerella dactyloides]